VEVGIYLSYPLRLPFPVAVNRQKDRVTWQFKRTILITPIWPLMWEKHVFENSHPNTLILIGLKLSDFIITCIFIIEVLLNED